jgi:hypothetical protein
LVEITTRSRGIPAIVADDTFGAVILRGVEKVDTEIERLLNQPNRVPSAPASPRIPSRLGPPQPKPATLTFNPVLPSVV